MLELGASRFNDPFHWPVLGTAGEHGSSLRTVILRECILPDRILTCYTDARAPKVEQIQKFSRVSWLFYHPKKKIQLRISGEAELHTDDDFAEDRWARTRAPSRLDYNTDEPPGTPVDRPSSGLPDFLREKVPGLLDSKQGRVNFMVIACRITAIDWLQLKATGHRRARFHWGEHGPQSTWLVP